MSTPTPNAMTSGTADIAMIIEMDPRRSRTRIGRPGAAALAITATEPALKRPLAVDAARLTHGSRSLETGEHRRIRLKVIIPNLPCSSSR